MISTDSKPVAEHNKSWPLCMSALLSVPFFFVLPRWPIGWDAIGFVLSAQGVDLSVGRPHPPGYPIFALLGSLFHRLGVRDPSLVSQAFGVINVLALLVLVHAVLSAAVPVLRPVPGAKATPLQLLVVGMSVFLVPGWTQLAVQCLPDLCAVALLAQGLSALTHQRSVLAGICAGLAIANRPSDGVSILILTPLVAMLFWGSRSCFFRALAQVAAGAVCALSVSLTVMMGYHTPGEYWRLCVAQGRGHFLGQFAADHRSTASYLGSLSRWFIEDSGRLVRVSSLLVFAALSLAGCRALRGPRERAIAMMCVLCAGLIRAITQSHAHSRHDALLGLVLGALALRGLTELLQRLSAPNAHLTVVFRRAPAAIVAVVAVVSVGSYVAQLCSRRSSSKSTSAAVASAHVAHTRGATMLFGLRNARAAELFGMRHFVAKNAGEMHNVAERLDVLPAFLYFTDEVRLRDPVGRIERVQTFCDDTSGLWITDERDAHCVSLFRYPTGRDR